MKKKNIFSLVISLLFVFNMVFCVSATDYFYADDAESYGTSDISAEDDDLSSADIDVFYQGINENPADSALTDGDTIGAFATTAEPLVEEFEDDWSSVTPGDVGVTGTTGNKLDLKIILIIAAVVILLILIALIIILIKKKNSSEYEDDEAAVEGPKGSVKFDIPVGDADEIRYGYQFSQNVSAEDSAAADAMLEDVRTQQFGAPVISEPPVQIDNTRDIIMSIYKGEAPSEAFTGNVVPLIITNIYDLQISSSIQPVFALGNDIYSSDYILVNDKYLYLNYHTFNKDEFRLYPDIAAVEKCFNIVTVTGSSASPANQAIADFEPAVFEINGTDFVISEKGKITVE